jgi:hypothetical protein
VISFLTFHAIATHRGEGLHHSLVGLFERAPSAGVNKYALGDEASSAIDNGRRAHVISSVSSIVDRHDRRNATVDILVQPCVARTIGIDDLNMEIVIPDILSPYRKTCAVRLERNGAVTIVLGTRDPGQVASSYLAGILVERLGIPLNRVRLFYTGMHPSVRRTPQRQLRRLRSANVGGAIAAIGAVIESLCDRVIQKNRRPSAPQDKRRSSFDS